MSKNNILFISYYFPPIKAIGGIRTYNFAKYLIANEWNVYILTTSAHKILKSDTFFTKLVNSKYIYVPTLDIQSIIKIIKIFRRNKVNNKELGRKPNSEINNTPLFQKIRNSLPFNISYEGGFIYIFFGIIFALYNIKKNNIKYIYSTYSPNSNHIIAYIIKRMYPKIKWIADFRDLPHGDSESDIFLKKIQSNLNHIIYSKADKIVTVSDGIKDILIKYNKNIHVINNGLDVDINTLKKTKPSISEYFNIVYTGSLYGGKRDASLLFKVIEKLINENNITNKIKLIYAGNDGNIWEYLATEYNLKKYTKNYGLLSTHEINKLQKTASMFLMITWSTKYEKGILTGKFYEYLAYSKSIICIINGEKDVEIESKFHNLNCGNIFYQSNELKLEKFIINTFNQWQINNSIDAQYNYKELEKYTSKSLTNKLELILTGDIINE